MPRNHSSTACPGASLQVKSASFAHRKPILITRTRAHIPADPTPVSAQTALKAACLNFDTCCTTGTEPIAQTPSRHTSMLTDDRPCACTCAESKCPALRRPCRSPPTSMRIRTMARVRAYVPSQTAPLRECLAAALAPRASERAIARMLRQADLPHQRLVAPRQGAFITR